MAANPTLQLPAKSVVGQMSRKHTDPATGISYGSPRALRQAKARRYTRMLTEFASVVADGTLGQLPWERLPMESDLQYGRFRTYLTMVGTPTRTQSRKRSIRHVAHTIGISPDVMADVATKYSWALRAELWDRELDRQEDEEFKRQRSISARAQAKLGARLQDAANVGLSKLLTGAVDMSASEVAKLAETGVKIERLAMDKSTSNEATVTRFVYEGAKPKWADASETISPTEQVDARTASMSDSDGEGEGGE